MFKSENQLCPICCETFSRWNYKNSLRTCCQKKICNDCMYRHLKSVFSEGFVGDGRTTLTCPFGCNTSITDHDIRYIIKRANYDVKFHMFGRLFLSFLYNTGLLREFSTSHVDLYAKYFQKWTITESEKMDLRIYERWNIAIAMMNVRKQSQESNSLQDLTTSTLHSSCNTITNYENESAFLDEISISCPAPDCDYMWISSLRYQKQKLTNENATSNLFLYLPPKIEKTTEANEFWWDAEEIFLRENVLYDRRRTNFSPLFVRRRAERQSQYKRHPNSQDGRRCICPKCHASFCGLCRRPWITMVRRQPKASNHSMLSVVFQQIGYQNGNNKRYSHDGKKCETYASKLRNNSNSEADANNDDDFFLAFVRTTNSRMCPGCSMWVERTSGCNHMTCRCGTEWCYVCETPWSNRHYQCRINDSNDAQGAWCVIS